MSNRFKIAYICIAIVLIAITITAIVCISMAKTVTKESVKPTAFYSQWMGLVDSNTPVKEIAIPGSHDSATYTMSWVAQCQDLTVYEQLTYGIRYLDLRVEKNSDGKLYIFHGSARSDILLSTVLADVKKFIGQYKTETIILDFQHFKGDSQQDVHNMLINTFNYNYDFVNNPSFTVLDHDFITELPLYKAQGKCIIMWGSEDEYLDKSYIFKRNDDSGNRAYSSLQSYYDGGLHKGTSGNLIANGLPSYIERYKANPVGLFVLQGQLTDGLYIFGPRFRESQHGGNMNNYVISLNESEDLEFINIIMRDFVDGKKISQILDLNLSKGIIKSASVDAFEQGLSLFLEKYQIAENSATAQ